MKIQYCSDLHLEMKNNILFLEHHPIEKSGDILIIAGDLLPFSKMDEEFYIEKLKQMCKGFSKVFWLPGNHEYYSSTYRTDYENAVYENPVPGIDNLLLVDNHSETIGNTRLIFSTLWSYLPPQYALEIRNSLNDFYMIKVIDERTGEKRILRDYDYNRYHHTAFNFIRSVFEKAKTEKQNGEISKSIVVTYHVPTFFHYPENMQAAQLITLLPPELFPYIENSEIDYWIHGHHHFNHGGFTIGNTEILTNQLGYVGYGEHEEFEWGKILEV